MQNRRLDRKRFLVNVVQKYVVSAFVAVSFVAYALHERHNNVDAVGSTPPPQPTRSAEISPTRLVVTSVPVLPTVVLPTVTPPVIAVAPNTAPIRPTAASSAPPTTATKPPATPTAAANKNAIYKDGLFKGKIADAFFGPLQVSVLINNGKIADVQFIDYPHDRRTSVRINNQANPRLQSEAIQKQSAQVNIISGATLTSRAFVESLQTALDSAKMK